MDVKDNEGTDHLGDLVVDGRMILKCILKANRM
jgi:hypothetical protein